MTIHEILAALEALTITPEEAARQIAGLIRSGPQGDDFTPERAYAHAKEIVADKQRAIDLSASLAEVGLPEGTISGEAFSPFGADARERLTAFEGLQGQRFPEGIPGVASRALNRQFNVLSPTFEALRGLGQLPATTRFPQFLEQTLGQTGIDPRAVLGQVAGLFGAELDPTSKQGLLRESLIHQPEGQFQLARAAASQGLPEFLSPALERVLRRQFGKFQLERPTGPQGLVDPLSEEFLPYYARTQGRPPVEKPWYETGNFVR